jgi:hypothetical protein
MARSVSTPSNAQSVVYCSFECDEDDDFAFDDSVDNLRYELKAAFPSLADDEEWVGREDRGLVSNRYARIGISEYCGLVAVWAVPKEDYYGDVSPLGVAWAAKIEAKLTGIAGQCFGTALKKIGTASNGEAFFQAVNPAQTKGDMGLGFTSKEGWL